MAVANACLLLSDHQRFVECEMDESCIKEAQSLLVEINGRKVLSYESKLAPNENICNAARVFLADMDGIQASRKEDISSAPIKLLLVQLVPEHVHHFSLYHHDFLLFPIFLHIPLHCCSDEWKCHFHEVDLKALLALECEAVRET